MKKVIVNHCFGGYGWSDAAVKEILRRKGFADIEVRNNGLFSSFYVNEAPFYDDDIDREDPVAIQILEEFGSAFCSGLYSQLAIEEYDDSLFRYEIDEYDGVEHLTLFPAMTEDRVRSCGSMDEVINLLSRCGVIVPAPEKECGV